jgi:geranylgeranyl reductase family protein
MVYDTVVVGAGPSGSTAAYYLAKAGLEVLLLDKFDFPRDKTCGDALTPLALDGLDKLGLLNELRAVGCQLKELEVIAPAGHAAATTIPWQRNRSGYVLIVPRLVLDNAIRQRALAGGAKFEGRIHVTAIEPAGNGVVIKGGWHGRSRAIKARLAIIATGASLKLAQSVGILPQVTALSRAARAYFEDVGALEDRLRFSFAGVPLPGYGWVFPLPNGAANIGVGFFHRKRTAHRLPANPAAAFQTFIETPGLRAMLAQARQIGPVKGYPLHTNFATTPTFAERVLLVGEAAGLVNPLTGEGIDYALESGEIAARHLIAMFATGDLSRSKLAAYDKRLRRRFQGLFLFCNGLQGVLAYPGLLNWLVKTAAQRPALMTLLAKIVLGSPLIPRLFPAQRD